MDTGATKRVRVVATFTTLPDRYHVLKLALEALHQQDHPLDAIYLGVPKKARRLNKEYPPVPEEIRKLCTVVPVDVDYGPITKVYAGLVSEPDPNTLIISCDDDTIHEPSLVRKLVSHHLKHPDSAITGTGALIGRGLPFISIISSLAPFRKWNGLTGFDTGTDGRNVDLIFGVAGVLYRRGFFPPAEDLYEHLFKYSLMDDRIFMNDDVLISGYLSKQGITRKVFYDIPNVECVDSGAGDALSVDVMKMIGRMNEAVNQVQNHGFFPTMEPLALSETVAWRVGVVIVIIILIVVLIFVMYRWLGFHVGRR